MVGQGPVAMGGPWVATALGRRGAVGIVPYAATRPARSPGRPSSATIARPCQNRRPVSRHATTPATTAARAGLANDRFRPDLEGLRAVAILLVLLYHAHVPGFGGGFVGVDVFFVISGFLITGILVRDLDATGTISLGAFYARRARRLLPAAAVALVVTLLASAVLLAPVEIADVARDGLAAGLYVSNIGFALQATDYLQAGQAPSPLLHFWSLSVEEQFYLLWPALLLLAARSVGRSHRVLATIMASVTVASLVASVVLTQVAAPWAFFAPVTRAWELGLGALVAVMAAGTLRLGRRTAVAAGLLGLAGIARGGGGPQKPTPLPGGARARPPPRPARGRAGAPPADIRPRRAGCRAPPHRGREPALDRGTVPSRPMDRPGSAADVRGGRRADAGGGGRGRVAGGPVLAGERRRPGGGLVLHL